MAQRWIRVRRVGSVGPFPVVYGVTCVRPGGRWCAFVNRGNISPLSVTDRGEILLDFESSCRVLSWWVRARVQATVPAATKSVNWACDHPSQ